MKNTLTKIFLVTLTTVLLIGAMAGISVFATEAEADTYEIKSINVIHDEKSIVLIAVDLPSDTELTTAPDVVVDYTLNGETQTAKYHSYQYIEKYGKWYPVYYTVGIAPVDISESVTAVAYKTGAAQDASKAKSTSLAEYLYTRLYRDDVISATEGDDLDRKGMYLALLEYCSYAQNVFWNNDEDHASDPYRKPANEYFYVCSGEATVDGGESVLLSESAAVTLAGAAVAPAEYVQTGWSVKKYDKDGTYLGTEQVSGTAYTVESNAVVVPTYARAWEDYEDGKSSNGGDGGNTCTVSYETEDGNTFYRAAKPETAGDDYIYVPINSTDYADGDCTVFETKLRINHEGTVEFEIPIKLGKWNGLSVLYIGNKNANDRTAISVTGGSISTTYPGVSTNEWFTLRIENRFDANNNVTTRVYINGIYIGENTTAGAVSGTLEQACVYVKKAVSGGVDLDNTYFGEGKAKTFDDVVNDFEHSSVTAITGAVPNSNLTMSLKTGASAEIVTDGDNKYFSFTSQGWADKLTVKPTYPAATAKEMFVLEADVNMNVSSGQGFCVNLYGDYDTYYADATRLYIFESNGKVAYNIYADNDYNPDTPTVVTDVAHGEWFNLRLECYENAEGKSVYKVYINGTFSSEGAYTPYQSNDRDKTDVSAITAAYIYTLSGTKNGTISLDNIRAGFIK